MVRDSARYCMEPALESLYESTAYTGDNGKLRELQKPELFQVWLIRVVPPSDSVPFPGLNARWFFV